MSAVGITGSRHGLTGPQFDELETWLRALRAAGATVFHHGDCVGVDAHSAALARRIGYRIIGHPPTDDRHQAWFPSDETREPRYYHDRNRDIVSASDVLLACPAESVEQPRGGTWWTVRHAREVNKIYAAEVKRPVIVIGPDGRIVR
jgi:hypothetical protein